MKINEIFDQPIVEGGSSGKVRYNSEIAMLSAFTGASSYDDIPPNKLANPEQTLNNIAMLMDKHYDQKTFEAWHQRGLECAKRVMAHSGKLPEKYDWVAGENAGGVADLVFVGHEASGISIKDTGGITLANLTPKAIGLDTPRGADVLQHYVTDEFNEFKEKVFDKAIKDAKSNPDTPINKSPYKLMYNSESNDFTIIHTKGKEKYASENRTEEYIRQNIERNGLWQRPFGDWFQENINAEFDILKPLIGGVSREITKLIEETLKDSSVLHKILQFEEQPYYYATPEEFYSVPSVNDASNIKLKNIQLGKFKGTSQLFSISVGNNESDDSATISLYIRYANGLFAANPTVRVQSLKNPQFIAWDEI